MRRVGERVLPSSCPGSHIAVSGFSDILRFSASPRTAPQPAFRASPTPSSAAQRSGITAQHNESQHFVEKRLCSKEANRMQSASEACERNSTGAGAVLRTRQLFVRYAGCGLSEVVEVHAGTTVGELRRQLQNGRSHMRLVRKSGVVTQKQC